MHHRPTHWLLLLLTTALLHGTAAAQVDPLQDTTAADPTLAEPDFQDARALQHVGTLVPEGFSLEDSLLPVFDTRALAWIAAVLTLALVARVRPLLTMRNVDALVLSLSCLVLLLRDHPGYFETTPAGPGVRWYAYLATAVIAGYWFVRGLTLLRSARPRPIHANMAEGGLAVLAIAGLVMALTTIGNAPLSDGARDGFLGGLVTAETGHLPYGDIETDSRSPLLYLLFAGANRVVPSTFDSHAGPNEMNWQNHEQWKWINWEDVADLRTVLAVNATLFVLLFAAVTLIGRRLHSTPFGLTLGTLLCFYPGFIECFHQPQVTLPATLLAWTILLATIPGIGGLLAILTALAAGLAWGWAFLALPVLLGYFFGKRWNGFGAAFGLIVGISGIVAGLLYLVAPSMPRPDGAMRLAGWQPAYTAEVAEDGALVINKFNVDQELEGNFQSGFWRYLMRETFTLDTPDLQPALPAGVTAGQVFYQRLDADPTARDRLQASYRNRLASEQPVARLRAATRTVLESTWKPRPQSHHVPERPGTWALWSASGDLPESRWTQIRRGGKVLVGLIALVLGLLLFRAKDATCDQLLGGLLSVAAAAVLISAPGAVSNLVLLAPFVLACLAAGGDPEEPAVPATAPRASAS